MIKAFATLFLKHGRAALKPVLECIRAHVGAKLFDENFPELAVLAFTKKLPNIRVGKCGESGDLEFEKMVLCGI